MNFKYEFNKASGRQPVKYREFRAGGLNFGSDSENDLWLGLIMRTRNEI